MSDNQCSTRESGGVRCEREKDHDGGHWISDETINRLLHFP